MSILIKGMEMPKCCAECKFRLYEYCDLQRQDVYAVNIMDYVFTPNRHPNCPLIEVHTPHGRLIDIKSVEDGKFHAVGNDYQRWWNGALESVIDNAPTVIEAED